MSYSDAHNADPRSIPAKRPASSTKPAPTAEEVKEWKEGLEEAIAEVKKLDFGVRAF
jgi:hypothetical protein